MLERNPCPSKFTYIGTKCYYINNEQIMNWKEANKACKLLKAHLVELERITEKTQIAAHLLKQDDLKEHDFWLGAINPGLLWIWATSAKPVNPNTNITSIVVDGQPPSVNIVDAINKEEESILMNTQKIKGVGPCLRLTFDSVEGTYVYYGVDCASRQHFICEKSDETLDKNIQRISRSLNL